MSHVVTLHIVNYCGRLSTVVAVGTSHDMGTEYRR